MKKLRHTVVFGLVVACAPPAPASVNPSSYPATTHPTAAGAPPAPSSLEEIRKYVKVTSPRVILEHVRVIDGTGAAPKVDQNVYVVDGKIAAVSAGADEPPRADTAILDLRGHSVMPGFVGMHDHLWYLARPNLGADGKWERPAQQLEMSFSAPRLYLAAGVTTIRTTGTLHPYVELSLKEDIEEGKVPGPHLESSGPYLNPPQIKSPEDARQTVAFWADHGVTSFKAYVDITRAELAAVIQEAHARGLKVTGHLCSVTYEEAVNLGIDNLEHGFLADTGLAPDKKPDACPDDGGDATIDRMSADNAAGKRLIATLIAHKVAITSTLPNLASQVDDAPAVRPEVLDALTPSARDAYLARRQRPRSGENPAARRLRRDMDLERAFVAAGGLLIAGSDPVGVGGLVPGFADQREIELLVEAGFLPVEAIRIATLNGATFLGKGARIGSIAAGKDADLVVVHGDPSARIADIEAVAIVFKNGVGYDPQALLASARGHYGEY